MINGHLTVAGDINVDGVDCTGIFIETTHDELKRGKVMLYRDVEVRAALGAQPATEAAAERQPCNSAMIEMPPSCKLCLFEDQCTFFYRDVSCLNQLRAALRQ
jgi:hypothetical protein